jgi:hypothetical protein
VDAAIYTLVGSIVVAVIGGTVAITNTILNARHGRENSAKVAMDEMRARELAVKDERITLRDEQLLDCQREASYWRSRAERAEAKT